MPFDWEIETRTDVHDVAKAYTQGWVTDSEKREELRRMLEKLATDEATKPRSRLAAIKALLSAERLNLTERELELKEKMVGGADDASILGVMSEILKVRNEKVGDES